MDNRIEKLRREFALNKSMENYLALETERVRAGNLTGNESLDNYDFNYILREFTDRPDVVGDCPADPITMADVIHVVASDTGENDGPNWIALTMLADGRWAFIYGGCDYTGWG